MLFRSLPKMAFAASVVRKAQAVRDLAKHGGYGVQNGACPLTLLMDFDYFTSTLHSCKAAFPTHWIHHFAVKANPTRLVLAKAVSLGFGLEAASIGELRMAERAGASHIVYDSPLKSERDIAEALSKGVVLNIDNLEELECVSSYLAEHPPTGHVGIRVNPQVGAGSLAGFSTGTHLSPL
jgi:diaminopimelate decarboxylase